MLKVNNDNREEVIDRLARSYAASDQFIKRMVTHVLGTHCATGTTVQDALNMMDNSGLELIYYDFEDNGFLIDE